MNPFLAIILAALIIEFVVGLAANVLNLRALNPSPPVALDNVYKPEEYRNSLKYTRATTRFEIVTSSFKLIVLLAFWFAGGFNWLDQVVRDWGFVSTLTGVLYIGTLLIGYTLLTLPFSIYATFAIEERFGFNKTTPRTFVADQVKALALALLLGAPLLAAVLAFFGVCRSPRLVVLLDRCQSIYFGPVVRRSQVDHASVQQVHADGGWRAQGSHR